MTINTRKFVVVPALPESLEPLRKLAYNLWWTWNPPAAELFRRIDPDSAEVLARLSFPDGEGVSGLESDGDQTFYCGGGRSGRVRAVRRPER